MRKQMVAGNWKMNLGLAEAKTLATEVCQALREAGLPGGENGPQVVFFPPHPFLTTVVEAIGKTPGVSAGAQNCHQEKKGAFTGEVSAGMVRTCGGTHVLVGHSERRAYFGEDEKLLAAKIRQVLDEGLTPVYCCGEVLQERDGGRHFEVIASQLGNGLFWLDRDELARTVIAYEPVWAIGTGRTASPEQAQEVHAFIRQRIEASYGEDTARNMTILYGGSCNAGNARELFARPDVDGGLIGGASLKAGDFVQIIRSF